MPGRDLYFYIEEYVSLIREHIHTIEAEYPRLPVSDLHRRILYYAVLDAMAHSIFDEKDSRKRVKDFVRNYCDWSDWNKISLPHLAAVVTGITDPAYKEIKNYVVRKLATWQRGEVVSLAREPDINELREVWPKGVRTISGVRLETIQHVNLLYYYRNSLLHELRPPGQQADLFDKEEPYYLGITTDETCNRNWALQYPQGFLRKLCETGLKNLEKDLVERGLDPLKSMKIGKYWIDNMNM